MMTRLVARGGASAPGSSYYCVTGLSGIPENFGHQYNSEDESYGVREVFYESCVCERQTIFWNDVALSFSECSQQIELTIAVVFRLGRCRKSPRLCC